MSATNRQQLQPIIAAALYGGMCGYCGRRKATTFDHFLPLARGGTNELDNLIPACKSCNSSKRDRTMLEWMHQGGWARMAA